MKMKLIIPHGMLPTREQFTRAFLESHYPNHPIRFRRDSRLGNKDINSRELWLEIRRAHHEGTKDSLEWCHGRLIAMNIHWS